MLWFKLVAQSDDDDFLNIFPKIVFHMSFSFCGRHLIDFPIFFFVYFFLYFLTGFLYNFFVLWPTLVLHVNAGGITQIRDFKKSPKSGSEESKVSLANCGK